MFRGSGGAPEAMGRNTGPRIFGTAFLLIGVACFALAVYEAVTSMMTCGGSCADSSAFDILMGEFTFIGLFCAGAFMLVIGIIVFTLCRWGVFAERVPWWELHGRQKDRP